MDLSGRVAVVTGSSSGIGEAVARRFAAAGASVVVNSSSSVEAGERVAASLPDALYVQADIADEQQASHVVEAAVARYGRIDHLVNNAGWTTRIPHHDLDAVTVDVWRRVFEVNVIGTWNVSRAAVTAMRDGDGGSITNITSLAGIRPRGSSIPYATSKAALNHLTVLLANVVGPTIRVNAIAPGLIDTPWTEDWDVVREVVQAMAPLKRTGTPADVAHAVLMVATADYMTGEVVTVDGGMHFA